VELTPSGGDMPSKEFENLIQLLKSIPKNSDQTIAARRSDFEKTSAMLPIAEGVTIKPVRIDGINAEWLKPDGVPEGSVILYIHGGGYCVGSINTHRSVASYIAKASRTNALLIDYRLAPEHPFPAAIEDATTVYTWLLSNGSSPENIVIAGDSAGGGIAVSTLLYLKKNGISMPAAAVCISPWVDLGMTGESQKTKADLDLILEKEVLDKMAKAYIVNETPGKPLISPIYADLSGLPPMLIQVGTSEILLDDAKRLTQSAEKAGVDVTLDVWDEMIHVFQYFAYMLPEGQEAIGKISVFVQTHMGVE